MRQLTLKELQTNEAVKKHFDWIPDWTEESLFSCFNFLALELEPYEFFFSDNSACVLVKGAGKLGDVEITPDTSFGLRLYDVHEDNYVFKKAQMHQDMFKATEDSIIICFNENIFNDVCFGMGCGSMHMRFKRLIYNSVLE